MNRKKTLLIIGATGHFGGRICRRLMNEKGAELVVSSRNAARAELFAKDLRTLSPESEIRAARLDQSSPDFLSTMRDLKPDITVHTAGPYQGQDFRVARACIDVGSHYIDIADGRAFVAGIADLHAEAQNRDVLLVSGASTLPGLSSAVINHLKDRFNAIHSVEISIAPAHQTPRGRGTIAAVLSYCGRPFQVLSDGEWVTMHGWQNMKVQRYPELGTRLSAACDVPDLGLLPDYVVGCKTVTFHAALEAKWEQTALWLMGWFTRLGIITDWNGFVPFFDKISGRLINLGSDVGGMHVKLSGIGNDRNVKTLTWYLTARSNHGPEIPCAPALILTRGLIAGTISVRGAFPCLGLLTMAEFDNEVRDLDIGWTVVER